MVSTTGLQPIICKHQLLCSKHYLSAAENLFQDLVKRICAPEAVLVEADGGLGTQAAVRQRRRIGTLAPLQARQQLAAVCKSHKPVEFCSTFLRNDWSKESAESPCQGAQGPRRIGALAVLQAWQQLAAVCTQPNQVPLITPDQLLPWKGLQDWGSCSVEARLMPANHTAK